MTNVLLLNGIELHEKFFKCIIDKDINLFHELKNEIINSFDDMPDLNFTEDENELFNFPNFKETGNFSELTFDIDDKEISKNEVELF